MLSEANQLMPCRGCGALVPHIKGSAHPFIGASMGCWSVYGEVLLLQYGHSPIAPLHRLTADAYAVQHPGNPGPQSIQSVAVHLIGLYLVFCRAYDFLSAQRILETALKVRGLYYWLEPPKAAYHQTILDVRAAVGTPAHESTVRCWAEEVWSAWQPHHAVISGWLSSLEG